MNNRQKLVQQQFLNNEEQVIKRLNTVYSQALKDVKDKINGLKFDIGRLQAEYDWMDPNDPEKAKVKSMIQSKIYQKNYQEQLHKQLDGILNQMQTKQYLTVSDYLDGCYTDGFIGTIFDVHGQGVPIITPIDQESMVRAVQLDSKISKGLYTRLGEDVNLLKRKIIAQVSRGISTGMTFAQVAKGLSDYTRIGFNNAVRIARTEGHRIQCQAGMDAMTAAKKKGADVVKQWDATLDGRTRESHQAVDGEIRELDKPFSNGLNYPGDPSGGAAEVVNCRCAILQRARAAMDEDELQTLKDRAAYFGLDKSDQFDDFKKNYLKALTNTGKDDKIPLQKFTPAKTIKEAESFAKSMGFECSYKGVDLQVANEMNAAFQRGMQYCPKIKERMRVVGSAQQRNKAFKAELESYYLDKFKKDYPGRPESWYKTYAKRYASKAVGRVDSYTYAFASNVRGVSITGIPEKYTGIVVNNAWGGDHTKFLDALINDVRTKWHPEGTGTIASVFDHEIAHQIDYAVDLRNNTDMVKLWRSLSKTDIETGLSRYGAKNIAEFIAEGYAEYCNNPNPRAIAQKIGGIIEQAVKKHG